MKSVQTIQKTFRVFMILSRIGMILSFAWAGTSLLGMVCGIVWYQGGIAMGDGRELLYSLTETGGLFEMIGVLLSDVIFALTDGILFAFALRYFKAEQQDGTPFTEQGAIQIRKLGIRTIVLPLVAILLSASIYSIFQIPQIGDWGNLPSVILGIVMILISFVFCYGAELEERVKSGAYTSPVNREIS